MEEATKKCIQCGRTSQEIPILTLEYQGQGYGICPQHLPVLIHKPTQLADALPGAGNLKPYDE